MLPVTNENQLQAAFWTWAWNTYPQYRRMMWAVPNGQARTPYERNVARATGLLSGVWDLHIYPPGGPLCVIECKVGSNQLTVDRVVNGNKVYGQKEWGELMTSNGAHTYLCRTLPELQAAYRKIFGIV